MKFKKKITNNLKGNTIITCTTSIAATNVKNEKNKTSKLINRFAYPSRFQICISATTIYINNTNNSKDPFTISPTTPPLQPKKKEKKLLNN